LLIRKVEMHWKGLGLDLPFNRVDRPPKTTPSFSSSLVKCWVTRVQMEVKSDSLSQGDTDIYI
jgi:hypothetical protein